ncbi:hypothetical protein [Micromonospora arida]|uniref:hypothetical protein n=1 Tax=Micromonospora arida TaxID=2203715 RepID=UPI003CE8556B
MAFLAVRPNSTGAGYGTAMLAHHRSRLDHVGLPSWTSTTTANDLYSRHGYTPRPRLPCRKVQPCTRCAATPSQTAIGCWSSPLRSRGGRRSASLVQTGGGHQPGHRWSGSLIAQRAVSSMAELRTFNP